MKSPYKKHNLHKTPITKHYYIYGKHAVSCALQNPKRQIFEILVTHNALEKMQDVIGNKPHKIVYNHDLNNLLGANELHQGIAIKTLSTEIPNIQSLPNESRNIVILDQVTDPHNIGAILRSAAAFNIDTMILPEHNSPAQNGLIAKIASGGLEHVNILKVTNLKNSITELKQKGFWVIGLDGHAKTTSIPPNLITDKLVIILGSEGKGMRKLTLENCDMTIRIPMSKNTESLNVSNAAAIIFQQIYSAQNH